MMNATNNCLAALICAGSVAACLSTGEILAEPAQPMLRLEEKILLGNVRGRIDHMAVDVARQRLFVAELGNDSVGVVDIGARKIIHRITGLKTPQGVGYVLSTDTLYVANGGDGSVRFFNASNFEPAGQIDLGDDADNIRFDVDGRAFVGYGSGALAVIDTPTRRKLSDIALKGHPEAFQLSRFSANIFINVPDKKEIAVVDRVAGKQVASWSVSKAANFPMAINEESQHVMVVFRNPPALGVYSARDGSGVASVESCGDSDDVFFDAKRHRVYMSCGAGFIDVFDATAGYRRTAHIATISGARTSLFVPELDRLLVAARESGGQRAAIWIFRPIP